MNPQGFQLFSLYDAARGPFFLAALALFALGMAWRVLRFVRVTGPRSRELRVRRQSFSREGPDEDLLLAGRGFFGRLALRLRRWLRNSALTSEPSMSLASLAFHLLLLVLPFFLPAHNIILRQAAHFSLPTLPERLMDALTILLLIIGFLFLARRLFVERVRALSRPRDFVTLLLVVAPFISAVIAYRQLFDYRETLVLHMLLGDLLIALLPLTKLGHMPFLLLSRLLVAGENSWRTARRRWSA